MPWGKPLFLITCLSSAILFGVNVGNETDLNTQLAMNTSSITFLNNITLSANTYPVNIDGSFNPVITSVTINGAGNSLLGGSSYRGFFIRGAGSVLIQNLTLNSCAGVGGNAGEKVGAISRDGGLGGGGGGFGGALYIEQDATVTLENVTFTQSSAQGGSSIAAGTGRGAGGTGGGGFAGRGGNMGPGTVNSSGGATGGGGIQANGGTIVPNVGLGGTGGGSAFNGQDTAGGLGSLPGSTGGEQFC